MFFLPGFSHVMKTFIAPTVKAKIAADVTRHVTNKMVRRKQNNIAKAKSIAKRGIRRKITHIKNLPHRIKNVVKRKIGTALGFKGQGRRRRRRPQRRRR